MHSSLSLNDAEYEVKHIHSDSHGIFEIPLAAGKWYVNEIAVSDWDGRPKDRNLVLFSNQEPMKDGGQYSRFNYRMRGLEVSLPATSSAIPVQIEFRDALAMTWPAATGRGSVPDADFSTAAVAWRPVKDASEYEVQISPVSSEGDTRFAVPILTRRLTGLSLPLASLPQRSPTTLADEYTVHVFAFDAKGRLLTESGTGPNDHKFELTGATRLGKERQYVGFAGPPEVISAERETNDMRLELTRRLLDQGRLEEASHVLDQVTKDAEHGRASILRGRLAAFQGNCVAALKLFDKAEREGGCADDDRKLCER